MNRNTSAALVVAIAAGSSPIASNSRTIGFASALGPTVRAARIVVAASSTPCDVKIAATSPARSLSGE